MYPEPPIGKGPTASVPPGQNELDSSKQDQHQGQSRGSPMTKLIDDVRSDSYGYLVVAVLLASTFLF